MATGGGDCHDTIRKNKTKNEKHINAIQGPSLFLAIQGKVFSEVLNYYCGMARPAKCPGIGSVSAWSNHLFLPGTPPLLKQLFTSKRKINK